jgi:surface antigen
MSLAAAAVVTPAMVAAPATSASAVSHWSGGGTTIRGRQWLHGFGVNVIRSRQCTELASRLYTNRRWGYIPSFYGMRANRTYGPLRFHRNGSGYQPRPGDVLVELGGPYQHVAVVNQVVGRRIITMEQNAAANGVHTYRWNGRSASGAYRNRYVGGFIHSSRNRL